MPTEICYGCLGTGRVTYPITKSTSTGGTFTTFETTPCGYCAGLGTKPYLTEEEKKLLHEGCESCITKIINYIKSWFW